MILRPPGSTRTDPSFPTRRSSDLGRLTVSLPDDRLLLKADLATQSLDIIDVGPFIGYDPERLARQGKAGAIKSEEHTSELQSLMRISYAVFCLKKKK